MIQLSTLSGFILNLPRAEIARGIAIGVSSLAIMLALVCVRRIRKRHERFLDAEFARIERDDARFRNRSGAP